MRVVVEQPPFADALGKIFRLPEGTLCTFGDIIYNPSNNPIDMPTMFHETVHSIQQGSNPQKWWERYLKDAAFRIGEEVPAYQIQYKEAGNFIKDRNELFKYLMRLAKDLSGEQYGNMMTVQGAVDAIKSKRVFNFNA